MRHNSITKMDIFRSGFIELLHRNRMLSRNLVKNNNRERKIKILSFFKSCTCNTNHLAHCIYYRAAAITVRNRGTDLDIRYITNSTLCRRNQTF